jgi:hypothetical protein
MNDMGSSSPSIGVEAHSPHTGRAFAVSLGGLFVPPLAVVGLIMSIMAYERARRIAAPARLAIAGVVCSALGCLELTFSVMFLIGYAVGLSLGSQ